MASNPTDENDTTGVLYVLSLPEILEKIFGHLPAKDILNCRLVSFEWRLAASYSKNVIKRVGNKKEFVQHFKSLRRRFTLLPCRNFRLYGYQVKHLYPVLRVFGLSISRLELGYDLHPNSLIRILLWCKNLKSLQLEHFTCKGSMENIPAKLRSTWNNNPFPQLEYIGINEGYWKTDEALWTLIEALIRGSPKISTLDFLYGSDERCKRLIELLSIETNLICKLTKLKIRLQSNIQPVKSLLTTYPLILTHLEICVKCKTTTEIFIAMVASTLSFLKLSVPLDYVLFIRIIKQMKTLRTIKTNDVVIICDLDIELAKMIPNVVRLEMEIRRRDFDDIRMFGQRWMGIYPQRIQQNEKRRFMQKNLKYLISRNITINNSIIISDIFYSFQMLRKVSIDIFVDCLNCLARGLKNSLVQELCLVIINHEDPKQVTKQELNAFHDAVSNIEYLTDLDIYYYQINSTSKTLHIESTWKNFSQLKTIRLIGFNIPECMIHQLMKSKCLKLLRLYQCKLRMDTLDLSYDDIKFKIFQNRYPTALININCLSWNPHSTSKAVNFYYKHDEDMSGHYYFPN